MNTLFKIETTVKTYLPGKKSAEFNDVLWMMRKHLTQSVDERFMV
jgi:hypothetical protein